ncbi:MAG: S8 family serine peptidase [Tepidisphaeraceae bacterium]
MKRDILKRSAKQFVLDRLDTRRFFALSSPTAEVDERLNELFITAINGLDVVGKAQVDNLSVKDDAVLIEAWPIAREGLSLVEHGLKGLGFQQLPAFGGEVVRGYLPIIAVQKLPTLLGLRVAEPVVLPTLESRFHAFAREYQEMINRGTGGDSLIRIDASAFDTAPLTEAIKAAGGTVLAVADRLVNAELLASRLDKLADVPGLIAVKPAAVASTSSGPSLTQGDAAMSADDIRQAASAGLNVSGYGVTVGVISDSLGSFTNGLSGDQTAGELPNSIFVPSGQSGVGQDEGRAMLQIVHDVAPSANLAFATGFSGEAQMATNIATLAGVGTGKGDADIIVDDVRYFDEPFFQDGILTRAVDAATTPVTGTGARPARTYVTAAGNYGLNSYESPFITGTQYAAGTFGAQFRGGRAHDFDTGSGVDNFQEITLAPGEEFKPVLQWDEPYATQTAAGTASCQNDVDFYLLDPTKAPGSEVVRFSTDSNYTNDPYEDLNYKNISGTTQTLRVMIVRYAGNSPGLLKYIDTSTTQNDFDSSYIEHATASSTIFGHASAYAALAVAASPFSNTGTLEPYSSRGNTTLLFDDYGARLSTPDIRPGPDVTGPDGGNVSSRFSTTFVQDSAIDSETAYPNFFGTSAAAPHVAAVAALMIEGSYISMEPFGPGYAPENGLYDMLYKSAQPVGASLPIDAGAGFVRADRAVARARQDCLPHRRS